MGHSSWYDTYHWNSSVNRKVSTANVCFRMHFTTVPANTHILDMILDDSLT